MPRGGNRCKERPRRYELFDVLLEYAREHNGSVPSQYNWWKLVVEAGYQLNWTNFRNHIDKLRKEGFIEIDRTTNVLFIPQSHWRYLPAQQMPLIPS